MGAFCVGMTTLLLVIVSGKASVKVQHNAKSLIFIGKPTSVFQIFYTPKAKQCSPSYIFLQQS